MKAMIIRFMSFLLFFCLLFTLNIQAEDAEAPPSLDSAGCFAAYNIESGTMLFSKNADVAIYPASTVKIMTGLIVCDLLSDRVDEEVTLTQEMLSDINGRALGLAVGQRLKLMELMIAAFGCGYNDAVTALSVIACGSVSAAVLKMNEYAAVLGMNDTVYKNVTGLDATGQTTTVNDIVKAAQAAADNELYLTVSSYYTYNISFSDGFQKTAYSSNELMNKNSKFYCRSAKGMNSGATENGGACLVTYGKYNNAGYLIVEMGCSESNSSRFSLAQEMLDHLFRNYGYKTILKKGHTVGELSVKNTSDGSSVVPLILKNDLSIFTDLTAPLPEFSFCLITPPLTNYAPLYAGDDLGIYHAMHGDVSMASASVTVENDLPVNIFMLYMSAVKDYFSGRAFLVTVISAIALTLAAIITPRIMLIIRQKRRKYVRKRGGFKLNNKS